MSRLSPILFKFDRTLHYGPRDLSRERLAVRDRQLQIAYVADVYRLRQHHS